MSQNLHKTKPNPRMKAKQKKYMKAKCSPRRCAYPQQQVLGVGPKMINSILIGLNEDDVAHVRKIIDGLDEYEIANILESLDAGHRQKLLDMIGKHLNPDVLPELNDVVQEKPLLFLVVHF